ncbi:serine hydrolase domain-containing protein [Mucilaginibacter sp. HD30]
MKKLPNTLLAIIYCSALFLWSTNTAFAQPGAGIAASTIEAIGQRFVQTPGHIGLSVCIIKNGKAYSYHFGSTASKKGTKPTDSTIYEIASVTKTFTGILLAHAILEKRIALNDDVGKYLPQMSANLTFRGVPVKIQHLATHTSGLPKFIPGFQKNLLPQQMMERYNNFSSKQFLDSLAKFSLTEVPGKKFIYSNADAQLIGIILEKVYHKPFAEMLKKYITGPQRMAHTQLELDDLDKQHLAMGYDQNGKAMPGLSWWKNVPAAGYIKSDIADMLRYLKLNVNEKNAAIALAHRPIFKVAEEGADSIGLFWFIRYPIGKQRIIYHAGGSFGSTSYCEVRPGETSGIVLLANDAGPGTEAELKKIAALLLGDAIKKSTSRR